MTGFNVGRAILPAAAFLGGFLFLLPAATTPEVADAAANNNPEAVRQPPHRHADVTAPQPDGATALHWAARWDNLETADLLIHAGADPKTANRDGATRSEERR